MKKALLFTALFFTTLLLTAQSGIQLQNDGTHISVNTERAKLPVVPHLPPGNNTAEPDTTKRYVIWFEGGNGFFTTDPDKPAIISSNQIHNPFLISTALYDTTKDLRIIYDNTTNSPGGSSNKGPFNQYLSDRGVKIIPNVYDIVPGDTMAFALVYKTYGNKAAPGTGTHKLYFFYNNNEAFDPLVSNGPLVPGTLINFCRTHNGEEPYFPVPPDSLKTDGFGESYSKCIVFNIPNENSDVEKNLFVSLVAKGELDFGKSGSVYAVLTDASDNVIGTDIIPNMRFAPAHDPNYIVQRPVCLLLPKKAATFTYTVHFQNTGGGPADKVKMRVHLPKGMDWSSFNPATSIKEASFAGKDARGTIAITIDKENNILQVLFVPVGGQNLEGTSVADPATNPLTMGEITFTIMSTPNTEDSLQAYAEIFFHSVNPSVKASGNVEQYEDPVITKMATTYYKKCCVNCPDPVPPHCYKIIGLCWWWWVLILLALLFILFLVLRRRKNKKEEQENTAYRS